MRIHDAYTKLDPQAMTRAKAGGGATRAGATRGGATGVAGAAGASATEVTVSARARELSDTSRIDALRDQVKSGTLAIDAHAIAGKLVGGAGDEDGDGG